MTDKQIKNWRETLSMTFGSYAFLMPIEQITVIRDMMQNLIDEELPLSEQRNVKKEDKTIKREEKKEPPFDPKNSWFQKALRKSRSNHK